VLDRLERQWAQLAALGGAFVTGSAAVCLARFGPDAAMRWSVPVAIVLAWLLAGATHAAADGLVLTGSAHDGLGRALRPAHTPLDGDIVFAAGTGVRPVADAMALNEIAVAAADVLARAIARGVFEARALPFRGALPAWKDRYGRIMVSP